MKKMEKNFRVLNSINGMDNLYKNRDMALDENTRTDLVNNLRYRLDDESFKTILKQMKGVFYELEGSSRVRYFCECGYIGSTLDVLGKPRCQKCGNIHFIQPNYRNDLGSERYRFFQTLTVKADEDNNSFEFIVTVSAITNASTDTTLEVENIERTVATVKDGIITINEDYIKLLNPTRISDFTKKTIVKLFQRTEILNDVKKLLSEFKDDELINPNYVLLMIYLKQRGFNISTLDEKYIFNFLNIRLKDQPLDTKIEILKVADYIIDMGSLDNILKDKGVYDLKKILKYLIVDVGFMDNIKQEVEVFNTLKKEQRDAFFDIILSIDPRSYSRKSYYNEGTMKELVDILNDEEKSQLFKVFYETHKYIYSMNIISFFNKRYSFLKKYGKEKDELLYKHRSFYSLLNRQYLQEEGFPAEKVAAFDMLIEENPLKAYSLMKSRRNLTKKEIKEIEKIKGGK